MTNATGCRVVVLGARRVGKSAVTVRYLTQRYIGEYSSRTDLLYRHAVSLDDITTDVEILDTCTCAMTGCLYNHIKWGEAFVVVYSITDAASFAEASNLLTTLDNLKLPSTYTTLLLGNKRDLDHAREVSVDAGHELSLVHGCLFYEVSAAGGNPAGIRLAFQSLLRQVNSAHRLLLRRPQALPSQRAAPPPQPPQTLSSSPSSRRRKLGVNSVSKVLGNIFGKNGHRGKKRPSLSI